AYGDGELACTAEELGDMLIEMLQREFDLPCILEFGKRIRITAFQRAEYGIRSASCQYSRRKESANGDFVTACVDGKGNYYSIVSDGMGSGTRARIDSAFACGLLTKFLESGVGVEAAIEMLNTALMVKSSDESFATLDVCKVDLYTGKTTLYKAGGADTFVRSGKKVTKIKGSGLPVGVSGTLSLSAQSFTAEEDDVIIMTTDGADLSEQWLEQAFMRDSGKNMEELVKTVAGAARFNCEKGREDDISIVALQLKK
ncbi:MAG: SpoIIE family protein phosphatase, partial [Ruminococcaceae bacterium]|nr:SpoIIE family protein phosphatase [Oscillospiraceae bacterium]